MRKAPQQFNDCRGYLFSLVTRGMLFKIQRINRQDDAGKITPHILLRLRRINGVVGMNMVVIKFNVTFLYVHQYTVAVFGHLL